MTDTTLPNYPKGITYEDLWASMKETDRRMKEISEKIRESQDRTDRQISKLGSRFGELIEHMIAPNIMNKFNSLDFDFTKCSMDVVIKEHGNPNAITEVDIMLENGDIVIAVEVKSKPNEDDVRDHIYRMEKLRRAADLRGDKRRYQGAIAGAIMSHELHSFILKQGFYSIEQTGDTVMINIPKGFSPREW